MGEDAAGGAPRAFRLPCPPALAGPLGVAAGERRVRKAYFATLDALRTGAVDAAAAARLARLEREVRVPSVRASLQQMRRVLRFVRASAHGWPVIPAPRAPLTRLVVTVPAAGAHAADGRGADACDGEALAARYAWTLDWLRMHRWAAGRGLAVEWRRAAP